MVSVCILTYNQEIYIKQAIDSALNQNTSFNYELVIGEDCSTDQTRAVIEQYQKKYPNKIRLLLNDKNVGAVKNLAAILLASRGKYIAMLEGDDYWTSPNKLQKQVDFLQCNPDYSICFHAAKLVDRTDNLIRILPLEKFKKATSTLEDLLIHDVFMPTCSTMFRARSFEYFPKILFSLRNGCDWALSVLNAEHGLIGYLDETMSAYRSQSSDFAWSSRQLTEIYPDAIKINEEFNAYFDFKYDHIFSSKLATYHSILAKDYLRQGHIKRAFEEMKRSIQKKWIPKLFFHLILVGGPLMFLRGCLLRNFPKFHAKLKSIIKKNRYR